jgi:hypothetical protein
LFLLIVFFISSQVGLRFWPEFSKVSGIRIDYLSPTLHLLDILIVAWIAAWAFRDIGVFKIIIKNDIAKILFLLFMCSLAWNVLYAESTGAHIFGMVKLAEFGLFGILVAKTFTKDYIRPFIFALAASSTISSLLAVWQFLKQSSIGGLWYFFGERTFNISTIGISTVNLDQLILRPYAAFPHPNVLAFFLLTVIVFTVLRVSHERNSILKIFLIVTVIFSTIALFLTFSRVAIFLGIAFFIYAFFAKQKSNLILVALGLLGVVGLLGLVLSDILSAQFLLRGIDFRQELLIQSILIFQNNPYFGIGLNNFFVHQVDLVRNISPILFQPPHNIFVIAILSLGVFGWWIFPYAIFRAVKEVWAAFTKSSGGLKDFYRGVLFVLIAIITFGMFDHFFLTLEQSQIILALILGLSFARLNPRGDSQRSSGPR